MLRVSSVLRFEANGGRLRRFWPAQALNNRTGVLSGRLPLAVKVRQLLQLIDHGNLIVNKILKILCTAT